jgi:hypothetical protein
MGDMKALTWFLGLIVAGLVAIALFAYPAWLLVTPALDVPFHRVANRIGMLAPIAAASATRSRVPPSWSRPASASFSGSRRCCP